jgi:hypothetical protein
MSQVRLSAVKPGRVVLFTCGVPHRVIEQTPGSTLVEWLDPDGKKRRAHYAPAAWVTLQKAH